MVEDNGERNEPVFIVDNSIRLNLEDTAFVSRTKKQHGLDFTPVNHTHLDSFIYWVVGEFPDAGINLVECADGNWFIAADHGTRFNDMRDVFVKDREQQPTPSFFPSEDAALSSAFSCIQLAFPVLESRDMKALYNEYLS